MNALSTAQQAYAANIVTVQTERRAEYDVVAGVTHRLRDAANNARSDFAEYINALNDNRRLWRALATDVADPGNGLPESLRARLLYLADFTDHHTSKVMRKEANVMPLLEINMAILRGLKTERPST